MAGIIKCPRCKKRIPLSHSGAACLHHFLVRNKTKWILICPEHNGRRSFTVIYINSYQRILSAEIPKGGKSGLLAPYTRKGRSEFERHI